MRGTRGMFTRIPGNLLKDSGECVYFNIPGNVRRDSGECSRRFRGMFKEILGNVKEDFGESKFRFRFILWNLAYFLSNSAIKMRKNKRIFSALLITTYTNLLRLNTIFLPPFSIPFSFSCQGKGVITVHRCRGIKKL